MTTDILNKLTDNFGDIFCLTHLVRGKTDPKICMHGETQADNFCSGLKPCPPRQFIETKCLMVRGCYLYTDRTETLISPWILIFSLQPYLLSPLPFQQWHPHHLAQDLGLHIHCYSKESKYGKNL